MAPNTDNLVTRDLIEEAVPYSSANIFVTRLISSLGGMINEIIEVPEPLAAFKVLIKRRTFHCWIA